MAGEKNALAGNTTMLILKLLEGADMYGYQIIEELSRQSEELFRLKTGTLYQILHGLEEDGMVISYDGDADSLRVRKYYRITSKGRGLLKKKEEEWVAYQTAVSRVMKGGRAYVFAG
jgi:PadR family transcriptional regulator PadR